MSGPLPGVNGTMMVTARPGCWAGAPLGIAARTAAEMAASRPLLVSELLISELLGARRFMVPPSTFLLLIWPGNGTAPKIPVKQPVRASAPDRALRNRATWDFRKTWDFRNRGWMFYDPR